MPTVYPEATEENKVTPEYEELHNLRSTINEFKREMNKIVPAIENKLRFANSRNPQKRDEVLARENQTISRTVQILAEYTGMITKYQEHLHVNYMELYQGI
jgi:hypothetical protein